MSDQTTRIYNQRIYTINKMRLSNEEKKLLYESLQQQHQSQKLAEYGEAKKLLSGLTDLNYESGHGEHMYYKYLLGSNDKNDTALLEAYQPEEIYSRYIVRVAEKGFTVIDHPSEVYGIPDAHECIDGN